MLDIVPAMQLRICQSNASPFDLSEATSVTEWKGFAVGMTVDINVARGTALGEIHAIWINAKAHGEVRVVAFEVHVGDTPHYLTQRGVHHIVGDNPFVHHVH